MRSKNVFKGKNSINNLGKILKNNKFKKIFLVTNRDSFEECGAAKIINDIFKDNYCSFLRFYDFEINPKIEDLKKAIDLFRSQEFDAVIACGGGSALDMAKLINFFSHQEFQIEEYLGGNKKDFKASLPLIAIPTTSGSGSEATHFAALYVGNNKFSVSDKLLKPHYVLIDSQFTKDLSPYITAYTALDALAQSIESYWSVAANDESKKFAKKAIKLIVNNIHKAIKEPNSKIRDNLAKAAYYAGCAIDITQTTAPHALSYAISRNYGIPHGHAVALTLPSFFNFNFMVKKDDCNDSRGPKYIKSTISEICQLLDFKNNYNMDDKMRNFIKSLGLVTSLSQLSINDKKMLAKEVNVERLANNPRLITTEQLYQLLSKID